MILVVESDPIIRIDVVEILKDLHPNATIVAVAELGNFFNIERPDLVFLDVGVAIAQADARIEAWAARGTPIILTDPDADDLPNGWHDLKRPFSTEMVTRLVSTLRREEQNPR